MAERGLIPAGAGQTRWLMCRCGRGGAHPRRCGADINARIDARPALGSSPQVRGRRRCVACRRARTWAHPRRCGADLTAVALVPLPAGSSPQVRGRQLRQRRRPPPLRLIPAGAGQTLVTSGASWATGAHPRRCGADVVFTFPSFGGLGSSPQVRGRLRQVGGDGGEHGLIHAGAGQTH